MEKGETIKVLLIDDQSAVRASIASFLAQLDYRIVIATSDIEGIEFFHSACPDLVICNMSLSGIGGLKTLAAIFKEAPSQPIIIMADRDATDTVIEAMKMGASDYLIKPVDDMAMLELSVKSSLKRARMIEENRAYQKKLESINDELEHTLSIFQSDQQAGRHVQISMLPKPPQIFSGYRFNHKVYPSLYLSGDSVDYRPVSKHQVLFYIADVSGHGSSSAFITVLLRFRIEQMRREHIHSRFSTAFSPALILESLNKDLLDSGLDKHITVFMGMLDRHSNTLTFSVAGHHPLPVMYSEGEVSFVEPSRSSFPVGLMSKADYFEESIPFPYGTSLTLFSDGILEILKADSLLEKERLLLDRVAESKGDFTAIKQGFDLNSLGAVPDDIAIMNVVNQQQ